MKYYIQVCFQDGWMGASPWYTAWDKNTGLPYTNNGQGFSKEKAEKLKDKIQKIEDDLQEAGKGDSCNWAIYKIKEYL